MNRASLSLMTAVAAMLCCCARPAQATQHIVAAGDDWSDLASQIKPGDEVILMPGRHHSATLDDLRGLPDRPIVIRSMDVNHPSLIEAGSYGIRLRRPRWVQITDVIIEGARINGVLLDGAPPDVTDPLKVQASESAASASQPPSDVEESASESGGVTLSNLTIRKTGPRGHRHAIHLRHVDDVQVESCTIEGWAGSGIEIAGCRNVRIDGCILSGRDDHYQVSGIRTRAGSSGVLIIGCFLTNAGDQAICFGGASEPADFPADVSAGNPAAKAFEAQQIRVERCIIRGGQCAAAFVHCNQSVLRNCTILRPRHAVVSIRREQSGARFSEVAKTVMMSNLIVWEPGDIRKLMHIADADPAGLALEGNLWWSPDLAETLERLGPMPGTAVFPQVTEIDPKLDESFHPTDEEAELYGAFAP